MLKLRSPQTAHQIFWEHNNCIHVYEYDPTADGPECAAAKVILASHTLRELDIENLIYRIEGARQ